MKHYMIDGWTISFIAMKFVFCWIYRYLKLLVIVIFYATQVCVKRKIKMNLKFPCVC